jgi:putative glutathione S-transferase
MGIMIDGVRHTEEPDNSGRVPTFLRFHLALFGASKGNLHRRVDQPNVGGYTCKLYQMDAPGERGWYSMSELRDPPGIVPKGPAIDLSQPYGRDQLRTQAA